MKNFNKTAMLSVFTGKYTTQSLHQQKTNLTVGNMISPTEEPILVFFYKYSYTFLWLFSAFFLIKNMPHICILQFNWLKKSNHNSIEKKCILKCVVFCKQNFGIWPVLFLIYRVDPITIRLNYTEIKIISRWEGTNGMWASNASWSAPLKGGPGGDI